MQLEMQNWGSRKKLQDLHMSMKNAHISEMENFKKRNGK
jgi:hypothetical protein